MRKFNQSLPDAWACSVGEILMLASHEEQCKSGGRLSRKWYEDLKRRLGDTSNGTGRSA